MTRTAAESPASRSTSPEPKMVSAISHPRPIMDAVSSPATVRGSLDAAARLFRASRIRRWVIQPKAAAPQPSSGSPVARNSGSARASRPRSAYLSQVSGPAPSVPWGSSEVTEAGIDEEDPSDQPGEDAEDGQERRHAERRADPVADRAAQDRG